MPKPAAGRQERGDPPGGVPARPPTDTPAVQRTGLNPAAPAYHSQNASTSLWVISDRTVLLQTAQALAFNPDIPQVSRKVRIVLDAGSQRSYVTEQAARDLSLCLDGEQPVTIMTFGSHEEQSQMCNHVRLSVMNRGSQTKQLTLLTVPLICEPRSRLSASMVLPGEFRSPCRTRACRPSRWPLQPRCGHPHRIRPVLGPDYREYPPRECWSYRH